MADYITRWDPFRDVVTLGEAMDRLFDNSFDVNIPAVPLS